MARNVWPQSCDWSHVIEVTFLSDPDGWGLVIASKLHNYNNFLLFMFVFGVKQRLD